MEPCIARREKSVLTSYLVYAELLLRFIHCRPGQRTTWRSRLVACMQSQGMHAQEPRGVLLLGAEGRRVHPQGRAQCFRRDTSEVATICALSDVKRVDRAIRELHHGLSLLCLPHGLPDPPC